MTQRAPVYLDYAATTPVDVRVAARMAECLTLEGNFGNSGSSHDYGDAAREAVQAARLQVAAAVGAEPEDIVWTSGATEANNLALFGVANYYRDSGRHLVTLRTEHKAVLDPCRELQRRGWRVTYLVPDRNGVLDPAQVASALQPDTVLVSVMHVNNETGVIQDIAGIAAVCARHGTARLHVDAVQSVGKCPVEFTHWGVDLLSLSGHKAYGPKGVGALVVSRARRVQLQALHFGGGQERNLRSGTVATHQVAGMGLAFELAAAAQPQEAVRLRALRVRLWAGLEELGGVLRNGDAEQSVSHILNVSFEGVEGESLLAAVRPAIAVSTGSACTSATREASYVLRALGRDERLAESSLRFSLGRFSTETDIEAAIEAVGRGVRHLRRIGGHGDSYVAGAGSFTASAALHGTEASANGGASVTGGARTGGPSIDADASRVGYSSTDDEATGVGEASACARATIDGPASTLSGALIDASGLSGSSGSTPAGWLRRRPSNYNELTWRHFDRAANAGVLLGRGVRRGAAGSLASGTWVQFDVRVGVRGGAEWVEAVRFHAYGCPHVIAVADWLAEVAVGQKAGAALPEAVASLRHRFEAPVDELGRFLVVEDAWRMAFLPPCSD
jgi:cysteine desulfurase